MAKKQEIELFLSENGELKIHIKGITGPGCDTVLDSLCAQLGSEKTRSRTAEYYQTETNKTITKTQR